MTDMIDASISKKQVAALIEVLVGKPANPNDRASAERRFLKELEASGIAPKVRRQILAQPSFDDMHATLTAALTCGDQPNESTALADAAKRLDAGVETAASAVVAETEIAPTKGRAKTEAKAVKVPAGLADKPRIKKGAQIRADGLEEGGPDAILVDAVKQPGGALHSDLCQLVGGWKKCDRRLARAAVLVGLKLKSTREGGDTRFEVA